MTPESVIAEFEPAKESVGWAQDAIRELRGSIDAFFQTKDIAAIVVNYDAKTGEYVQKLTLTQTLPRIIARRATEALVTTRHAFDQALFAARTLTSGPSNKPIHYPWANNPKDLAGLLRSRGIDQRLWSTVEAHEPYQRSDSYPGGNDIIRTLAKIANDKHTIGLSIGGNIVRTKYPNISAVSVKSFKLLAPQWNPKKNEAELVRWIGDVKVDGQYRFDFEVTLKDSRLAQPVNAMGALVDFSMKANTVIETLQARCLEIAAA